MLSWYGKMQKIWNINIYSFVALVRYGVPVFLMVSGALLLNKDIEITNFLKKKVQRIITPFLFYYILTTFIIVFVLNSTHNQVQNIFAFRWYFWMILGVYLSIPIINKFILYSDNKEIEYFISLFLFGTIFYQILYYFNVEQYLYLTLFLSPLGYLVLGYYLSRKEFNISANKIIIISILLFFVSTFIKFEGNLHIIPMTENYLVNKSAMLNSWLDVGILEITQSSSVFLLCKYIYQSKKGLFSFIGNGLKSKYISKFILSVSRASYGMYLINLIPTFLFYYLKPFTFTGTQVCLLIFVLSISTFFISWIIVLIFSKIPLIRQISGYD